VFSVRYALRLKYKFCIIDTVLCEVLAEADETFEHGSSFVIETLRYKTRAHETVGQPALSMIDCNRQISTFKLQKL
jgi:hypothetical protein